MEGQNVIVLANLKSRNMAGVPSHGMVLCASDASHENVELLIAPEGAAPGERVIAIGGSGHMAILKQLLAIDGRLEGVAVDPYF